MNARNLVALVCGTALLSSTGAVAQEDEGDDEKPLRCLSMSSIRSTKIVDDNTVLFYQGRRIFVNRLDRECVGLTRNGTFTYQVQSGARYVRLCDSDSITVLEPGGRGFNCGLGLFDPVSEEEAESFVSGPNRAVTSAPVEVPQGEEPAAPAPAPETAPEPPPQ